MSDSPITDEYLAKLKAQPSRAIGLSKKTFFSMVARIDQAESLNKELVEALHREHLNQCDHDFKTATSCVVCTLIRRAKETLK